MINKILFTLSLAFALLGLGINDAYALKIELDIPSGMDLALKATPMALDNNITIEMGSWNIIPVRLIRDAADGTERLDITGGIITCRSTASSRLSADGSFSLGSSPQLIEYAEFRDNYFLEPGESVVIAKLYVKSKKDISFLNAQEQPVDSLYFMLRLPGSEKNVAMLSPAAAALCIMPRDVFTIKGTTVKAMVQILAAPVSTAGAGGAQGENDYTQEVTLGTPEIEPANTWKKTDVIVSNPVNPTNPLTVTIPYSSDRKPTVTAKQSTLYSCGYFNLVATPNVNVKPTSKIGIEVTGPISSNGKKTFFTLAERLLAFGNTYYKTTEGGAVAVDFVFTSALTKPMQLYFKQIDGVGIDIGDGIPSTQAEIKVDYVGETDVENNKIVYNQSTNEIGVNTPYMDLPTGFKSGRLLVQTLNNGRFSLRRGLVIVPGGSTESNAVAGGATGQTSILIDEIGLYPRTKIAWANPYAKVDGVDNEGKPIKVDMFNNINLTPPQLTLKYVNESDTLYHGSVSKRTVPYNKGSVFIYAESDIASASLMQVPVQVKLPLSGDERNILNFELDAVSAITKTYSNNVIEFFCQNASTKDVLLKFKSDESDQSLASSFGKRLELTVKGKPSYATLESLTSLANVVKQGKSLKYRIKLADGPNSLIKGSRSQDLLFNIVNLDTAPASYDKAILNINYTLPTRVSIPAGKNYVDFEIKTTIAPSSIAQERYKAFTFGVTAPRAISDSAIDPLSPIFTTTRQVIFKPETAKPKTEIWTSINKLYSEINKMTIFSIAMNTEANTADSYAARISFPKMGNKNRFLLFSKNGVDNWTTELSNIPITKQNPIFIYVRALSTYSYNGNFTAGVLIEVGRLRKTVNIVYSDYRPYAFPDYSGIVPGVQSEFSLYPLHFSTKNATNYANKNDVDSMYPLFTPVVYNLAYEGLTAIPNLSAVDSTAAIDDYNGSTSLPKLVLNNVSVADTGYGFITFGYGVKNPLAFTSTDTILVTVGGAGLKYSTGVNLVIEGQRLGDLPKDVKSVFAEYSDPVQKSYKVKQKKVAFKIKTVNGSRYAYLNKSVKLYSETMLKKILKNGKNSISVPQKGAIELKIGYTLKGAAGTYEDKLRRYIVPPQDLLIKTWFDGEVSGNAKGNPLHPGSIVKLSGKFLGSKPTITLESTENGVSEAGRATCKILSIEPDIDPTSGNSSMYVQLPSKLPRSWDYTAAHANLVINSGSGIAAQNAILFSAQFDGYNSKIVGDLDTRPDCLSNVVARILNTNTPVSKKSTDIHIIGQSVDEWFAANGGLSTKGFMITDANSDKLQIVSASIDYDNSQNIQGKISIIKDSKTGGETIRFTRTGNVGTPGRVKIIFVVKETYASKVYNRTSTGSFFIDYNN